MGHESQLTPNRFSPQFDVTLLNMQEHFERKLGPWSSASLPLDLSLPVPSLNPPASPVKYSRISCC